VSEGVSGKAILFAGAVSLFFAASANAARWTKASIAALPDSAFASVESDAAGRKHRHLPHHDARGALDIPHLCSALRRFRQVKWLDPKNAQPAWEHFQEHWKGLADPLACAPRRTRR
jgi:hypothetical protein